MGTIVLQLLVLALVIFPSRLTLCSVLNCSSLVSIHIASSSSTGRDCQECLEGKATCATLDYVLNNLPNCSNITMDSNQSVFGAPTVSYTHHINLWGSGNTLISLTGNITFLYCNYIQFIGVSVDTLFPQGEHKLNHSFKPFQYNVGQHRSVMTFVNCSSVNITHSYFEISNGTERAIMFFNLKGQNIIANSTFSGGPMSGGIILKQNNHCAEMTIYNCSFFNNTSQHGGALEILLLGNANHVNNLLIQRATFRNNSAKSYGGHVNIVLKGKVKSTAIIFANTNFTMGNAMFGGVASVCVNLSSTELSQSSNTIKFVQCSFNENHPLNSGVLYYIQYDLNDNIIVSFVKSNFTDNSAVGTWTVKAILDRSYIDMTAGSESEIKATERQLLIFQDCQWYNNYHQEGGYSYASIYSIQIPLYFNGTTIMSNMDGPAIMLVDAIATFAGDVLIQKCGLSFQGGGIYLSGMSFLNLIGGLNLVFRDTNASYGGAIYSEFSFELNKITGVPKPCVFIYEGKQTLSKAQSWNATVKFLNTKSLVSGNAIYLTNNIVCSNSVIHAVFFNNTVFPGLILSDISSPATNITFTSPGIEALNFESMSGANYSHNASIKIMLGQPLTFNASILDILDNPTVGIVTAEITCEEGRNVSLNNQAALAFRKGLYSSSLSLIGPRNETNCTMLLKTFSKPTRHFSLKLHIVDCYSGFVYDNTTNTCVCNQEFKSNDAMLCELDSGVVCVKTGYWYGLVDNTYYLHLCVGQNSCNLKRCTNSSNVCQKNYCHLPKYQDEQCGGNRGGPLCLICNSESVLTFDAVMCIPSKYCQPWDIPLIVFLYLLVWFVFLIVFYISLKLDFRIGSGYLYGIVYYFSVIANVDIGFKPFWILSTVVGSVFRLDPKLIGFLPLCSFHFLNQLDHQVLHYMNSLMMCIALFVFIKLAQRFKPFSLPTHSPEHGICTIILLTFTSLSETSLNLLYYIKFPTGRFVYFQPNVRYFDTTHHLPFALVALFVQVFLLLPFTALLLFAPSLSRWVNFIRIKPILDNFQACYKDNMRWMAGFYFLCRLTISWLELVKPASIPLLDISILLNLLILSLMAMLQPYKKQHLNYIDSLLLLNLIVSEYLIKIANTTDEDDYKLVIQIVLYLLLLSAILYTGGLLIAGTMTTLWSHGACLKLRYSSIKEEVMKMLRKILNKKVVSEADEGLLDINESETPRIFQPKQYRDSILEVFEEKDQKHDDRHYIFNGLKSAMKSATLPFSKPSYTKTEVSLSDEI